MPNDDSTPDTDVFQFDGTLNELSMSSSDIAKIGSYDLKIQARYTGIGAVYNDVNGLAFTVVIDDPCAQTFTIDPSILPRPLTYTLGDPALQLIFD